MSEQQQQTIPPAEVEEGRGCCFYGCLVLVLLALLAVFGGGFGLYYLYMGQLEKYTSDQPADLPTVEYTPEEIEALQGRVDAFKASLEAGEKPEDLVLTAEEINALIAEDEDLRGKVFVRIEEGQVSGDISIPMDFLPGGSGRYFNGSGDFDVQLESGDLFVYLTDAEINGKPLPAEFIEGIKQENLAKDVDDDPEVAETLRRFDSLTIEGDTIILRAHAAESEEKPTEATGDQTVEEEGAADPDPDGDAGEPSAENTPSESDADDGGAGAAEDDAQAVST